jgi:hypothetical protein
MSGAPDEVQAPVIDNPNPTPVAPTPEPAPPAPVEARAPSMPEIPVDPRIEIANRFKKQRQTEEGPFTRDASNPNVPPFLQTREPTDDTVDDLSGDEPAPPPVQPVSDTPAEKKIRIKVRSNEFELTRDQLLREAELTEEEAAGMPETSLIRIAQKNIAANSYLEDARNVEKEARRSLRTSPEHHGTDSDQNADDQPPPPPSRPPVAPEFKELVEKVQYGEPEEAAAALQQAVESVATRQQMARFRNEHGNEVAQALEEFQSTNSDLFADEFTAEFVGKAAERLIKDSLVKAGLRREDVERVVTSVDAAREAYIEARMVGYKVPAPKELLAQAGAVVRNAFNRPAATSQPQPTAPVLVDTRTVAKRAIPQQPQRATVNEAVSETPAPKSRSDAVAQMRKARGQN